jgi:Bacteriocin-protection, YdeI or OmpD-Associated
MEQRRFRAVIQPGLRGSGSIESPFAPEEAWGKRARYHLTGKIGWMNWRGPLTEENGRYTAVMGPAWLRDCPLQPGMEVEVLLMPEGAQLDEMDDDIATALAVSPGAARFFESLAQFYRKAYLKWLDGAKRRPDVRRERLQEFVELLQAGRKSR